jgi:hypothetical protein
MILRTVKKLANNAASASNEMIDLLLILRVSFR